jgi:hypothetical protein
MLKKIIYLLIITLSLTGCFSDQDSVQTDEEFCSDAKGLLLAALGAYSTEGSARNKSLLGGALYFYYISCMNDDERQ